LTLGQLLQDLLKHLGRVVLTALTARRVVLFAHPLERPLDEAAAHGVNVTVRQFADTGVQLGHGSLLLFKEKTIPSMFGRGRSRCLISL
jgi:hypothetical protein